MENQKAKGRGGARVGAGRKSKGKQKVATIRINEDLIEIWNSLPEKSGAVNKLLREAFPLE